MSRRALAEKRPYLMLSVVAALAFYYLRWTALPEYYLVPVKGAAAGFLAIYCFVRHSSADARLLGWALGAAALGDVAMEFVRFDEYADRSALTIAALLFFLFHMLALAVFLRHRREALAPTQSWVVGLTLILTPVIAYFLPGNRELAWQVALYALALGAMASAAWASSFPRYRVGAGAMLFVASDLLIFAELGPLAGHIAPQVLVWPIYYLGQFLICTGVIQSLRKRDPELRVVSSRD